MADLNLASSTTNNPSLTNRVSHCAAKNAGSSTQNKIEIDYDMAINQPSERIQRQHIYSKTRREAQKNRLSSALLDMLYAVHSN